MRLLAVETWEWLFKCNYEVTGILFLNNPFFGGINEKYCYWWMRLYRLSSGGLSFDRGDQVTVIDNCSVGNLRNLAHQMENTNLRI